MCSSSRNGVSSFGVVDTAGTAVVSAADGNAGTGVGTDVDVGAEVSVGSVVSVADRALGVFPYGCPTVKDGEDVWIDQAPLEVSKLPTWCFLSFTHPSPSSVIVVGGVNSLSLPSEILHNLLLQHAISPTG